MFLPTGCHGYIRIMKTTSCHSLFCLLCVCVCFFLRVLSITSRWSGLEGSAEPTWPRALSTNWEELLFESATAHSHILEIQISNIHGTLMAARFFPSHQWLTYLDDHLGHMIQNWMQLWTIDNYKDSDTGILDIISLSSHALFPFSKPKPSKHGQLKFHWLLVSSKLMPRFICHPQAKWRIADANALVPLLTWSNCG